MFCKNCGNPLTPDDKFCNVCGQANGFQNQNDQVQNMNQAPQENFNQNGFNQQPQGYNQMPQNGFNQQPQGYNQMPQNGFNQQPQGYNQMPQNGFNQQPQGYNQNQQPEKKGGSGFIIVVIILVLAIVGVVLYLLLKNDNVETPPTPNPDTTQTEPVVSTSEVIESDGYQFTVLNGYTKKPFSAGEMMINTQTRVAIWPLAHRYYPFTNYKNAISKLKSDLEQEGIKITKYEVKTIDGVELLIFYGTTTYEGTKVSILDVFNSIGTSDTGEYILYSYTSKSAKNFINDVVAVAKSAKKTGSSSFAPTEVEENETKSKYELIVPDEYANELPTEIEDDEEE